MPDDWIEGLSVGKSNVTQWQYRSSNAKIRRNCAVIVFNALLLLGGSTLVQSPLLAYQYDYYYFSTGEHFFMTCCSLWWVSLDIKDMYWANPEGSIKWPILACCSWQMNISQGWVSSEIGEHQPGGSLEGVSECTLTGDELNTWRGTHPRGW